MQFSLQMNNVSCKTIIPQVALEVVQQWQSAGRLCSHINPLPFQNLSVTRDSLMRSPLLLAVFHLNLFFYSFHLSHCCLSLFGKRVSFFAVNALFSQCVCVTARERLYLKSTHREKGPRKASSLKLRWISLPLQPYVFTSVLCSIRDMFFNPLWQSSSVKSEV